MPIATNPSTGETVFLDADGAWKPAKTSVNPETSEMLAFDGEGWKPLPASKGVFARVDDAVRSIASGITFGWADEFAAKMDEMLGRGTYAENLSKEQARDAQIPVSISLPGEVAGAVGSSVLLVPVGVLRALAEPSQASVSRGPPKGPPSGLAWALWRRPWSRAWWVPVGRSVAHCSPWRGRRPNWHAPPPGMLTRRQRSPIASSLPRRSGPARPRWRMS